MKFDKETGIVIQIAAVILICWFVYYPKYQHSVEKENRRVQQQTRTTTAVPSQESSAPSNSSKKINIFSDKKATAAQQGSREQDAALVKKQLEDKHTLENNLISVKINSAGGIESVELKKYLDAEKKNQIVIGTVGKYNTFQTNDFSQGTLLSFHAENPDKRHLVISRTYTSGLTVRQHFELPEDNYLIRCSYQLTAENGKDVFIPEMNIWSCGVPPLHDLSGDRVNSDRHNLDYYLTSSRSVYSFSPDAKESKFASAVTSQPVAWYGSTNKYFASLLFANSNNPNSAGICLDRVYYPGKTKAGEKYVVPSIGGIYRNLNVSSNNPVTLSFEYYCGPKEISRIQKLPEGAMDVMHISWFSWFEFIARPLTKFLLLLKGFCGSYGIAIILLTVIVRLVFWPITQKANSSMRKMQKIQPMVKELREKFSDPKQQQELNMRMMELYKREGVNPLGGCLPILLQIPVFFALYSALDSAVELRQVAFLWATDLTKADLIGPAFSLPFFSSPIGFHPLVIAMTVLMVIQQKMTPSAGDPMQQKMMMAMPIVMLFVCYSLPSGLTLYWTVSQIFSILQLKYSQYLAQKEESNRADSHNKHKFKSA